MKLEVLISTMYRENLNFVYDMNTNSDCLIVNQTDNYDFIEEFDVNGNHLKMFNNCTRGLSFSRNEAILQSNSEICVICDDDVVYNNGYENTIIDAFDKLPQADIIVFNISRINNELRTNTTFKKVKKSKFYKTYNSVRIAFRRESILRANLWFNVKFGTGSEIPFGEDSLFILEAKRKGLKVYEYPANILTVDDSNSSWFSSYNEEYFYKLGFWIKEAYPLQRHIIKLIYSFRFKRKTKMNYFMILREMNKGIKLNRSINK